MYCNLYLECQEVPLYNNIESLLCVGILEMVTDAETLRSIQTSHGLTGALNEKRLAEWLMKHNNSDVTYKKVHICILCNHF